MSEFLSFFRFVLPGINYFGLCLSVILIYDHSYFLGLIKNLNSDLLIGFFGLFFASGCIGYVLSILYRVFFPVHGLDQVYVVNALNESAEIEIIDRNGNKLKKITNSRKGRIRAYEIINVLWHLNHKFFDADKTIFQASVLNSMGAIFIGCFASFITGLFYAFLSPKSFSIFDLIISQLPVFLFLSIIWFQYIKSRKMYERWMNSTFTSRVKNERANKVSTEHDKFVFKINYFE